MAAQKTNIIWARHRACHNFAPFLDTNPNAKASERYKALGGTGKPGLIALTSPDGVHWQEVQKEPVLTKGAFDSQNVSFWSTSEACYVCYFRVFVDGIRRISRSTSDDFVHWTEPVLMQYRHPHGDGSDRAPLHQPDAPLFSCPAHLYFHGRAVHARPPGVDRRASSRDQRPSALFQRHIGLRPAIHTWRRVLRPYVSEQLHYSRNRRNELGLAVQLSGAERRANRPYRNVGLCQPGLRAAHGSSARYSMRLDGFASVRAEYAGGELTHQTDHVRGRSSLDQLRHLGGWGHSRRTPDSRRQADPWIRS